jgi:thymidylate synthase ThyX
LELLIRRFASKELAELRELNSRIYSLAKDVAPSIILFTEVSDFDSRTYDKIAEEFQKKGKGSFLVEKRYRQSGDEPVRLVNFTPDADDRVLASLLHTTSNFNFRDCLRKIQKLTPRDKKKFFKLAFQHMEFYDFPLREFEYVDLTYDLCLSASCFAQLKRHRMATLTAQRYNPDLGVTIPRSVEEIGARAAFMEMMERTNEVYFRLKKDISLAAEYVLTNAHRRRALLKVNARELYHISRLREDATAQWDIRDLAGSMSCLAKKVMPLTCLLLGGKDSFSDMYKKVFGKTPKSTPPIIKSRKHPKFRND